MGVMPGCGAAVKAGVEVAAKESAADDRLPAPGVTLLARGPAGPANRRGSRSSTQAFRFS